MPTCNYMMSYDACNCIILFSIDSTECIYACSYAYVLTTEEKVCMKIWADVSMYMYLSNLTDTLRETKPAKKSDFHTKMGQFMNNAILYNVVIL